MSNHKRISALLRMTMDDLEEMYNNARLNQNEARMEKISKAIADFARKIRDQETYERETISRGEFLELIGRVGEVIGRALEPIEDDNLRTQILDVVSDGIADLAEGTFSNDDA